MFSEKIFADRLKSLRQSKNINLTQLGNSIGCNKAALSNFENCYKKPSLNMILSIANYFDVSIDYLVGRTDVKEINKG